MKYSIIICDDNKLLATDLSHKIQIALQNMLDNNEIYRKSEFNIDLIANTFEQVVSYVVAKDIHNAIYFLDIELIQKL